MRIMRLGSLDMAFPYGIAALRATNATELCVDGGLRRRVDGGIQLNHSV
jgi:hypothetical protein